MINIVYMTIISFSYFSAYDIGEYLTQYQKLHIYNHPYNLHKDALIWQTYDVSISTEYRSTIEKIGFYKQNFQSDEALSK
jgi:hypothetical protein